MNVSAKHLCLARAAPMMAAWRQGNVRSLGLGVAAFIVWSAGPALGEDDLLVGHNGAGQLIVQVGFAEPLGLPVSVYPGLPGYATGDVGLHSAAFDDPTNDFFRLSPGADFRFILLAKTPGMEVWNDHGSAYMQVGESFYIGPPPFDTHPLWDLVSGARGQSYDLTLIIRDLNGLYADSEPVVLAFTATPPVLSLTPAEPGWVRISWTPTAPGLVLQSSPTLAPSAWTTAPSGATNPAIVPVSPGAVFFRLNK